MECFKEIFVLVSWVLQYFHPDKPYYMTSCGSVHFIAMERSVQHLREEVFISHSLHSCRRNEKNHTAVGLLCLLFYYLDISELMWAMIWEFPGARLQLFPLYHLRFSSATGFYYSPIRNLRSAVHSEQIDAVLNLVVLRMYIHALILVHV